ncbi:MAG: aldo/keto reductase [Clostridiales bacterium]|jgi:aryl-alcohol dehydrogenase-like predicted oxidoreductase|nr:aldo/keto reductase [Clostridiales bacterium]
MEYAVLGGTGRKVSRLGYGGTIAGLKHYVHEFDPEDEKNKEILLEGIETAYGLGVTYFDTAAAYGDGVSERIFGEGLEKMPEDGIFLATKVSPGDAAQTRASLERSLKNLRRERIDLIQIHGTNYTDEMCDAMLGKNGMAEVLEKAKSEGLVRYIGFTIECQNPALYRFIRSGRFDVMQIEYNLMFQHPYDPSWGCGSLYDAESAKLGIAVMRTATSGIFQRWIQQANPANTFDYTPALIQLVLSNPLVDVALLGMRTAARVRSNVDIVNDAAHRIDLDAMHKRYPN